MLDYKVLLTRHFERKNILNMPLSLFLILYIMLVSYKRKEEQNGKNISYL